jgi:16S rRNA processing protein RimM
VTESSEAEVVIGVVVAPFGIRGEAKVTLQTDFPERFRDLRSVRLRLKDGESKVLKVKGVRFHKGMALVKFVGFDDIDAVETLRGAELVVPKSELVELAENQFYIHDLIGLHVYGTDGRDLGEIEEVIRGLANDAYVTAKTIIPALKSVVREVDLTGRKMIVEFPEGAE